VGTRITLLRPGRVAYRDAWRMQQRIADEVRGGAPGTLILLEHPPVYTLGSRGDTGSMTTPEGLLRAAGAEVVQSDRGGDITFHGPGQVVGYPIINLRARGEGPAAHVRRLEQVMLGALAEFGIAADRSAGRPGAWCGDAKIGAIGVRVARGVTMHGFALNVDVDLSWFDRIVPCGLAGVRVTSMREQAGVTYGAGDVQDALARSFARVFDAELVVTEAGAGVGS